MTHIYGNAVPVRKYLRERRSHAFPHHYTHQYNQAYILQFVENFCAACLATGCATNPQQIEVMEFGPGRTDWSTDTVDTVSPQPAAATL